MKKALAAVFVLLFGVLLIFLFSDNAFVFVFHKKVWSHKTNTLEAKRKAMKKFSGVELDLVYKLESGIFDVHHPPDPSTNLSLADYLKTDLDTTSGYWFDIKNLNEENAQSACNKLDSIVGALQLNKKNIVVESSNYPYLKPFASKGFLVSYYMRSLHKIKGDSLVQTIKGIKEALRQFPYLCISSGYLDYPLMKHYFPDKTKLLWWAGSKKTFWNWRGKFRLYKMMSDETVKVLLVPFF